MKAVVSFCDEDYTLDGATTFTIGREADLSVDDNPYLHRKFLTLEYDQGLWWLNNVGSQLSATISDGANLFQGWLSPGGRLPLVFEQTHVRFTAGPTVYEIEVRIPGAVLSPSSVPELSDGTTTIGRTTLTPDQRLLVIALAEPLLRQESRGTAALPTSAAAADRLGWTMTKFNRKLDNVCQKLERHGVRGLHGGPDRLAASRRARLVEYALAVGLVGPEDLRLLDGA
jgi:hypothetical protein